MPRKAVELIDLIIEGKQVTAKSCSKCSEVKPLDSYDKSSDGSAGGRSAKCKACKKVYREQNRDAIRAKQSEHYQENKERLRKEQAVYYAENKELFAKNSRRWYDANKEHKAQYDRQYRAENVERRRELGRIYYHSNIESERARGVLHQARRRSITKGLPTIFDKQWKELIFAIYQGCAITGSQENIHWDHFIPLASNHGGTDYRNMIPLQGAINMSKNASNPLKYFTSRNLDNDNFYDTLAILSFLNDLSIPEYIDYVNECFTEEERINVEEIKRKSTLRYRAIDAISAHINVC